MKALLEDCKRQLEKLQADKEQAIEEFLEHLAEEKFTSQQDVKMKYQKMLNLLKNAQNKEEKTAQLEEKKKGELAESVEEYLGKKKEGLKQIKESFNELALKVKVDARAIQQALLAKAKLATIK